MDIWLTSLFKLFSQSSITRLYAFRRSSASLSDSVLEFWAANVTGGDGQRQPPEKPVLIRGLLVQGYRHIELLADGLLPDSMAPNLLGTTRRNPGIGCCCIA